METAFWIIATIILCFVCAYKHNQFKQYQKKAMKLIKDGLALQEKMRIELEKEKADNKFYMKRIFDQQKDIDILRKTMK